jgi:hypothetical protein
MTALHQERCAHHAAREAAAKCLSCGRFFCRECVTEHLGRVLCAECLAREGEKKAARRRRLASLRQAGMFIAGFFLVWLVFHTTGRALMAIPDSFHEGTVWEEALP